MSSKIVGWLVGDWDSKKSDLKKNLNKKKLSELNLKRRNPVFLPTHVLELGSVHHTASPLYIFKIPFRNTKKCVTLKSNKYCFCFGHLKYRHFCPMEYIWVHQNIKPCPWSWSWLGKSSKKKAASFWTLSKSGLDPLPPRFGHLWGNFHFSRLRKKHTTKNYHKTT